MAVKAIAVLRKYQLLNPADKTGADDYPEDTDLHPYWAIWKAAVELDGRLHWDELNRVLMWILKHENLDAAIAKIRAARARSDLDMSDPAWAELHLGVRAYDQATTTDGRDPSGQVRDQKTTPWFKRAAFGELLFTSPGSAGMGYWAIHPDVRDLLEEEVRKPPPQFQRFDEEPSWFSYYGGGAAYSDPAPILSTLAPEVSVWHELLIKRKNVVFFGPPGTGKTYAALEIAKNWEAENGPSSVYKVTFHPSYGYEEFVQGFRPTPREDGEKLDALSFELRPGVLLTAAQTAEAFAPAGKRVLLVIDEINRGDVARIFGELITYIEPGKRGVACTLAHSPTTTFSVPENIYFLGTMNTADKSVSLIDVAMRRRFAFVGFPADPSAFEKNQGWLASVSGVSLRDVLATLNSKLASEGIETDRSVGQALLKIDEGVADPLLELRERFEFDILPLVAEYCYMDRSRMRRIVGPLVDEAGSPSLGSVAEFEERLKVWLGTSSVVTEYSLNQSDEQDGPILNQASLTS